MAIDYDEFRNTPWEERIAIFSGLTPEGKSELFRSQVSGWLERHRNELTPEQIEILEEAERLATPEMYAAVKPPELLLQMKDFEQRARVVLGSHARDALTMEWGHR